MDTPLLLSEHTSSIQRGDGDGKKRVSPTAELIAADWTTALSARRIPYLCLLHSITLAVLTAQIALLSNWSVAFTQNGTELFLNLLVPSAPSLFGDPLSTPENVAYLRTVDEVLEVLNTAGKEYWTLPNKVPATLWTYEHVADKRMQSPGYIPADPTQIPPPQVRISRLVNCNGDEKEIVHHATLEAPDALESFLESLMSSHDCVCGCRCDVVGDETMVGNGTVTVAARAHFVQTLQTATLEMSLLVADPVRVVKLGMDACVAWSIILQIEPVVRGLEVHGAFKAELWTENAACTVADNDGDNDAKNWIEDGRDTPLGFNAAVMFAASGVMLLVGCLRSFWVCSIAWALRTSFPVPTPYTTIAELVDPWSFLNVLWALAALWYSAEFFVYGPADQEGYEFRRVLLGFAVALAWCAAPQHFGIVRGAATLSRTLSVSVPELMRCGVGVAPVFIASVVCFTVFFGPTQYRFQSMEDTATTLFANLNGDVLRETFAVTEYGVGGASGGAASFAATFLLFLFNCIFLYVVVMATIAVIEESFLLSRPEAERQADVGNLAPTAGGPPIPTATPSTEAPTGPQSLRDGLGSGARHFLVNTTARDLSPALLQALARLDRRRVPEAACGQWCRPSAWSFCQTKASTNQTNQR